MWGGSEKALKCGERVGDQLLVTWVELFETVEEDGAPAGMLGFQRATTLFGNRDPDDTLIGRIPLSRHEAMLGKSSDHRRSGRW